MGITGTEVTKDAAEMILTDDNFATIVAAVEGGRGLYDNLMKYIRVQMIMLAGFILTFVGAGIFEIADGSPLLPLQILWINFAIDVLLAVGLGFDAPSAGPDARRPRSPDEPVIPPALGVRLGVAGLLIAIGTLAVVAWGEDRYGLAVATTMGLVTTSLLHMAAALEWRDPYQERVPPRDHRQRALQHADAGGGRAHAAGHDRAALQRIFDTVDLDGDQWRACLGGRRRLRRADRGGQVRPAPARSRGGVMVDAGPAPTPARQRSCGTCGSSRGRPPASPAGHPLDRRRRVLRPVRRRARRRRQGRPRPGRRPAHRRPGAAVGERHLRRARRVPGDGRRRQGLDDQARDVRGQPPGRGRRVVQEAVERGARPHLPVAHRPRRVPERGRIGIFNRSHYEEVVAIEVHPDWLDRQHLPRGERGPAFWDDRYDDINAFERHLDRNGTKIVKFFLNVSKAEQKRRFMARLDNPGSCGSSTPPT